MTKLEEEISDAMNEMAENNKTGFGLGLSDYSKAAAEVAKRYIEKMQAALKAQQDYCKFLYHTIPFSLSH